MIESKYVMDMQSNYLVLEGKKDSIKGYLSKMILNNNIPGILKVELRSIDDKDLFYYNITSHDSLLNTFEKQCIEYKKLKLLLVKIIEILERGGDYLLLGEDFILDPKYIYIDKNHEKLFLCYYIGYKEPLIEQFKKLFEYLMDKVNYKDEKAVLLVYGLYKIVRESNITFEQLKLELSKNINPSIEYNGQDKGLYDKKLVKQVDNNPNIKNDNINNQSDKRYTNHSNESMTFLNEVSEEKEILSYSKKTYIFAGISIFACLIIFVIAFQQRLVHNAFGLKVDTVKLLCLILIITSVEGLILSKLFHKDKKVTKYVKEEKSIKVEDRSMDIANKENGKFVEQGHRFYKEDQDLNVNDIIDNDTYNKNINTDLINNENTQVLWSNMNEEELDNKTEVLVDLNSSEDTYYLDPCNLLRREKVYINTSPFIVGKHSNGVNYVIDDSSVSRFHAKFIIDSEKISIIDLGSTNGTYINGSKIKEHVPIEIFIDDEVSFSKEKYILLKTQG